MCIALEMRRKAWFMFFGSKPRGDRPDYRYQQLKTNKQAVHGVLRGLPART